MFWDFCVLILPFLNWKKLILDEMSKSAFFLNSLQPPVQLLASEQARKKAGCFIEYFAKKHKF